MNAPVSTLRTPVSLITGFLGSGKTTLLNHLLQHPGLVDSLVIINEFGEVGIDHLLVATPSENMRLLANGCLCCAVRGDLVDTLNDAHRKRGESVIPKFDRVLIETTGLADPVPIIQTLVTDEDVAPWYQLDTVVSVVDAVHAQSQLDNHSEAVKQIAVADLLLLSKTDLADPQDVLQLTHRLMQINQAVQTVPVLRGVIDPRLLFGRSTLPQLAQSHEVERWLGKGGTAVADACALDSHQHCDHDPVHATHDDRVQTFTLFHDSPASKQTLATWLTLLANFRGANLLRVKGLINVDGRPVVVQAVQTVIHEPVELEHWPSSERRSQVVLIVRDADPTQFSQSLQALSMTAQSSGRKLLDPAAYARFLEMANTLR